MLRDPVRGEDDIARHPPRMAASNDVPDAARDLNDLEPGDRARPGRLQPDPVQPDPVQLNPGQPAPAEADPVEAAAAPPAEPAAAPAAAPAVPPRNRLRQAIVGLLIVAAGTVGYRYGAAWWRDGRFIVTTEDAYIGAEMATVSSKLNAHIAAVEVHDNQAVKAGDVLFRLDEGDYRLALQAAEAKAQTQRSEQARIDSQIAATVAGLAQVAAQGDQGKAQQVQAAAQAAGAAADLTRAQSAYDRVQALARSDYSTRAALEEAAAQLARAKAGVATAAGAASAADAVVAGAEAALAAARANVKVLEAQRAESDEVLKELQIAAARARRDLSFVVVAAPFDGVIANKTAEVGDYVSTGKRLASLVPMGSLYVDANFKETQLRDVAPGAPVTIHVDAIGEDQPIRGAVQGMSPGTGSVFSLLPPDNATGNFTKIVQRVPVRITLEADARRLALLRPGLSVTVSLDSRDSRRMAQARADGADAVSAARVAPAAGPEKP